MVTSGYVQNKRRFCVVKSTRAQGAAGADQNLVGPGSNLFSPWIHREGILQLIPRKAANLNSFAGNGNGNMVTKQIE